MNQRDATVIIIDFVRSVMPDDKSVLRALKVLDRRAEVLRLRNERRNVEVPADLHEEPLTFARRDIITDLRGTVCRPCGGKKRARESFCTTCYNALDASLRKAMWRGDVYDPAYCRAVRVLVEARSTA